MHASALRSFVFYFEISCAHTDTRIIKLCLRLRRLSGSTIVNVEVIFTMDVIVVPVWSSGYSWWTPSHDSPAACWSWCTATAPAWYWLWSGCGRPAAWPDAGPVYTGGAGGWMGERVRPCTPSTSLWPPDCRLLPHHTSLIWCTLNPECWLNRGGSQHKVNKLPTALPLQAEHSSGQTQWAGILTFFFFDQFHVPPEFLKFLGFIFIMVECTFCKLLWIQASAK